MATKITRVFQKDKVVGLTHSAGNISIQSGSILTIGGLQYILDSQKSVALPAMTANTRYQVFAVITGGDVALQISTNENSVGPAGFTAWKLVGSLYSDGSLSFGSFLNVKTKPSSSWINGGPSIISATSVAPTKGTMINDKIFWKQDGEEIHVRVEINQSVGGVAGTGMYLFGLPGSRQINTQKMSADNTVLDGVTEWQQKNEVGSWSFSEIASDDQSGAGPVVVYDSNYVSVKYLTISDTGGASLGSYGSTSAWSIAAAPIQLTLKFSVPVLGWSDTPIEDL